MSCLVHLEDLGHCAGHGEVFVVEMTNDECRMTNVVCLKDHVVTIRERPGRPKLELAVVREIVRQLHSRGAVAWKRAGGF